MKEIHDCGANNVEVIVLNVLSLLSHGHRMVDHGNKFMKDYSLLLYQATYKIIVIEQLCKPSDNPLKQDYFITATAIKLIS